jgi:hypothetical protein
VSRKIVVDNLPAFPLLWEYRMSHLMRTDQFA